MHAALTRPVVWIVSGLGGLLTLFAIGQSMAHASAPSSTPTTPAERERKREKDRKRDAEKKNSKGGGGGGGKAKDEPSGKGGGGKVDDDTNGKGGGGATIPDRPVELEGRTVELIPGTRYRATIELEGLKALANNDMIAQELQKGGPNFSELNVLGMDTKRTATGVYIGPRKTWELPKEIVKLERVAGPKPEDKPKPKPDDKPSDKPKPDDKPAGRTPTQAATFLYSYATEAIRAGKGSSLGTKGHANETVKLAQRDMRKIEADGIYGPKTRARGKELLGKPFPEREATRVPSSPVLKQLPPGPPVSKPSSSPATSKPSSSPKPAPATSKPSSSSSAKASPPPPASVPAGRAPQTAASELLSYVQAVLKRPSGQHAAAFGYKDHPNEVVRAAQKDMGELATDGIYGPSVRARGKALIGKDFPARA